MAIQGNLETIGLANLLSLVLQLKKSGVLHVVNEHEERGFVFYRGDVLYASSKDGANRLGDYLVRLGYLSDKDVEQAFQRISGSISYVGQKFVEIGCVTREQLRDAVRTQVYEIVNEVMGWKTGAFYFDDRDITDQPSNVRVLSTQSVLLDCSRVQDERAYVARFFPDSNVVLSRTRHRATGLTRQLREVLDAIDGKQSIDQLLREVGMDVKRAVDAMHWLYKNGLVRYSSVKKKSWQSKVRPELYSVPLTPGCPGQILEVFGQSQTPVEDVCTILRQEPMMVAKLLKTAMLNNFEMARADLSLERLVSLLGDFHLRFAMIPEGLKGFVGVEKTYYWRKCWDHSILCAELCYRLARLLKYDAPGEAYLAGLLHNLGVYLLLNKNPTAYQNVVQRSEYEQQDLELLEEQEFGVSHSRIGSVYAEKWKFPIALRMAIRQHHTVDPKLRSALQVIVLAAVGYLHSKGIEVGYHPGAANQLRQCLPIMKLQRGHLGKLLKQASESAFGISGVALAPEASGRETTASR